METAKGLYLEYGPYRSMQQQLLRQMLQCFNGNKNRLTSFPGISRNTLSRIIKDSPAD